MLISYYLIIATDFSLSSIEDEAALKAKVDEALAVYDEYVKSQGAAPEKKEEETKA
jgi:hypothetical protein